VQVVGRREWVSESSRVEALVGEVEENLARYRSEYGGLSWREKVLLLVKVSGGGKEISDSDESGGSEG